MPLEKESLVARADWRMWDSWRWRKTHFDSIVAFSRRQGAGGAGLSSQLNGLGDVLLVAEGCEDAQLCRRHLGANVINGLLFFITTVCCWHFYRALKVLLRLKARK